MQRWTGATAREHRGSQPTATNQCQNKQDRSRYNIFRKYCPTTYLDIVFLVTGCSLNIVFFSEDFKIFRTLAFLSKNSIFNEHPEHAGKTCCLQYTEYFD